MHNIYRIYTWRRGAMHNKIFTGFIPGGGGNA